MWDCRRSSDFFLTKCVYAQNGLSGDALQLFRDMLLVSMKSKNITFIGVPPACNHSSLDDKAWHYFESMDWNYGIVLMVDHYAYMINLLGHSQHLRKEEELIDSMPFVPNVVIWSSFLVLAVYMVIWNCEIGQPNALFTWNLKVILLLNCYKISMMQLERKIMRFCYRI